MKKLRERNIQNISKALEVKSKRLADGRKAATHSLLETKLLLLKELSVHFKVPPGRVIDTLLEKVAKDDFKNDLYEDLKKKFS